MRRRLLALLATGGIWFVASLAFSIVAHLNGKSRLIYLLGALVIVLIPLMLVLLFSIMRHVLSDDTPGTTFAPEVVAAAMHSFPAEERAETLAILATYGIEPHELERTHVQLAILRLSEGELSRLQYFTDQAKAEYRDVLAWDAEMPDRPENVLAKLDAVHKEVTGGTETPVDSTEVIRAARDARDEGT